MFCELEQKWNLLSQIQFVTNDLINIDLHESSLINYFEQRINEIEEVWKEEDTLCLKKAFEVANKLKEFKNNNRKEFLNCLKRRRFDKNSLKGLRNSLILGDNGGLYLLINSLTSKDDVEILLENGKFSKEFINSKQEKHSGKLVIGKGGFGKVRLAITVFGNKKIDIGEIVCVKKSFHLGYKENEETESLCMREIFDITLMEYLQAELPKEIYSPKIIDMALVLDGFNDQKTKGYVIMEVFPHEDGKTILKVKLLIN